MSPLSSTRVHTTHMLTHTFPISFQSHPAHEISPLFITALTLLLFFSPSVFCPASIVTVIRLVNDAVDNIESEGMKEYPLLTPLSILCLSSDARVFVQWCNTKIQCSELRPRSCCSIPYSIQNKASRLDFQYFCQFPTLDLSVFKSPPPLVSVLFGSVFL